MFKCLQRFQDANIGKLLFERTLSLVIKVNQVYFRWLRALVMQILKHGKQKITEMIVDNLYYLIGSGD